MHQPFRYRSKARLLAGVALGVGLALPAMAADVTPDQAKGLEQQVRDAIGGLLGPSIKIADRPVQVTPAGDHFDVVVPLPYTMPRAPGAPASAPASGPVQVTATAKPGESGIWLFESVRVTSPLRFTLNMPAPRKEGDRTAAPSVVPVLYTVNQQGQDGRIVWDPSARTPSTWTVITQASTVQAEGGPISQTTTIGPVSSTTTLRPAGTDRVDVLMDGTMQDYTVKSAVGTDAASAGIDVSIRRLKAVGAINGLNRARAVSLTQMIASTFGVAMQALAMPQAAMPPGAAPVPSPKVAQETVRALLDALQDLASDFMLDEVVDGLLVKAEGQTVGLDQVRIGADARSDAGMLRAGLTLGVQGISLPDVPLGAMAELIPRRVSLRPVIGGMAVADLLRLTNAAAENRDPSPAEISALFSKGGVTGGLESLVVEVAGATFTGQGKVVATAPSPDTISGTAQLTAENFDGLMQKIQAMPEIAQQAVPAMVFIKGVGRTVDNKLVWDVVYKDGKVLINNVDITAMAGGSPAAAPRPPQETARPPVPVEGAPKSRPTQPQGRVPSWAK